MIKALLPIPSGQMSVPTRIGYGPVRTFQKGTSAVESSARSPGPRIVLPAFPRTHDGQERPPSTSDL